MTIQITLIGLGEIGASMGLALGAQKENVLRVGHDKNPAAAREAQKKGAVDKIVYNLPASVEGAKIVVLALPLNQIEDTFRYIAQDVPHGALVLDTAPVKAEVAKWARKYLPSGRHYVGLVPAINPDLLERLGSGLQAAQADLFARGLFFVDAPPGTPGDAVALASDFVRLLGAAPLFADMLESDGLTASTHILPQLLAASLIHATVDQPGWQEARKVAGRAYAVGTAAVADEDEAESLGMAVMQNREIMLHKINSIITSLFDLREEVENGDEKSVVDRFKRAREARGLWLQERITADWAQIRREPMEVPSMAERLMGTLFSKPRNRKRE